MFEVVVVPVCRVQASVPLAATMPHNDALSKPHAKEWETSVGVGVGMNLVGPGVGTAVVGASVGTDDTEGAGVGDAKSDRPRWYCRLLEAFSERVHLSTAKGLDL